MEYPVRIKLTPVEIVLETSLLTTVLYDYKVWFDFAEVGVTLSMIQIQKSVTFTLLCVPVAKGLKSQTARQL